MPRQNDCDHMQYIGNYLHERGRSGVSCLQTVQRSLEFCPKRFLLIQNCFLGFKLKNKNKTNVAAELQARACGSATFDAFVFCVTMWLL